MDPNDWLFLEIEVIRKVFKDESSSPDPVFCFFIFPADKPGGLGV